MQNWESKKKKKEADLYSAVFLGQSEKKINKHLFLDVMYK